MSAATELLHNLSSPPVLCFTLGFGARVLKSDLRLPEALAQGLSIYLLLAIGLKGGASISGGGEGIWGGLAATLVLAFAIPLWTYGATRRFGGLRRAESASIAAHYGSTSAVTFLATLAFLDAKGDPADGFMTALLAVMEVPAILVGLLFAGRAKGADEAEAAGRKPGATGGGGSIGAALWPVVSGKTVALLLGGMVIGWISGPAGKEAVAPFFVAPFTGVLCLFLLDLGRVTADRLDDLWRNARFLLPLGIVAPIVHGALGVAAGHLVGLSTGSATALGILAGSASYIAAPAAMQVARPDVNHGLALAASLCVTFPFNLTLGIPLLHWLSRFIEERGLL